MARAMAASKTPTPAISETRRIPLISLSHARECGGFESGHLQSFATLREMLEGDLQVSGRGVIAGRAPFMGEAGLPQFEEVLELGFPLCQAGRFRPAHNLS